MTAECILSFSVLFFVIWATFLLQFVGMLQLAKDGALSVYPVIIIDCVYCPISIIIH